MSKICNAGCLELQSVFMSFLLDLSHFWRTNIPRVRRKCNIFLAKKGAQVLGYKIVNYAFFHIPGKCQAPRRLLSCVQPAQPSCEATRLAIP